MIDIEGFSKETFEFTKKMGYAKNWSRGGCYIHLEASEFIEVLRGKEDPTKKLGDLLTIIFSVCENYNISVVDGIEYAKRKMKKIQDVEAFKSRGLR